MTYFSLLVMCPKDADYLYLIRVTSTISEIDSFKISSLQTVCDGSVCQRPLLGVYLTLTRVLGAHYNTCT